MAAARHKGGKERVVEIGVEPAGKCIVIGRNGRYLLPRVGSCAGGVQEILQAPKTQGGQFAAPCSIVHDCSQCRRQNPGQKATYNRQDGPKGPEGASSWLQVVQIGVSQEASRGVLVAVLGRMAYGIRWCGYRMCYCHCLFHLQASEKCTLLHIEVDTAAVNMNEASDPAAVLVLVGTR